MSRGRPRTLTLDDAILAALRQTWPGYLTTGEVAACCGSYDVEIKTWCNGDHADRPSPLTRVITCTPDMARVAGESLRGDREPVTHLLRLAHDSQTVGPRLTAMYRAGTVLLAQRGNWRRWACAPEPAAAAEASALEALLLLEGPTDA